MSANNGKQSSGSGGFKSSRGPTFGKLEQIFEDVWWAWGTTRFMPGVLFPRNMTIVREGDGLVIIHPVLMPEEEQRRVEALGAVKHIVRLGAFHGMDDALYVKRYAPTVWAPPGVDVSEGVTVHKELLPGGELPLSGATLFRFEGSRTPETAIHLDRHGGMLLSCDSVQNWQTTAGCSLLGALLARMMGFRGRACIGPGWRKASEPKDGRGFAPDFERLLKLEFRHIVAAHGAPIKDTGKDDLRSQAGRLYGI